MNDVYLIRYKMIGYISMVYFREQGLYYGGDFKGVFFINIGLVFCQRRVFKRSEKCGWFNKFFDRVLL